jgi:DUF438 domain-containing protein
LNCIHIVNQIVEAFKKGKKDIASFLINMGEKFILIKYFAMRDEKNNGSMSFCVGK